MLVRIGVVLGVATVVLAGPDRGAGASPSACGVERWPVKVLSDSDRARVDTTPVEATLADLNAIPIPEIPYPNARRIAPHELRTYRVRAVLAQVIVESDKDWHLVLQDERTPAVTMIAEIPSQECTAYAADAERYQAARAALRTVPRRGVVEVVGVGFFDFIHNQRGRARNGFELHPVLRISAIAPPERQELRQLDADAADAMNRF